MNPFKNIFGPRESEDEERADEPTLKEQRQMIAGVEQLAETTVKEVMVPRTDTVFLPSDAPVELIYSTFLESGHSRIPVYGESIDQVVGVLYAKDLLGALVSDKEVSLPSLVRKAYFVPETKRIDSLLREFKRRRVHIAIVVDEYGGTSGIVCLEDIIEEIVGEIQDEFDEEPEEIVQTGQTTWSCEARLRLDEIEEKLHLGLPVDEFDSLAGYVFELFGRIPEPGESVETGAARFTVAAMEGHRIRSVKIERLGTLLPAEGGEVSRGQ